MRKKLQLTVEAIRTLTIAELRDVEGGAEFKASTPGGVCNPDPPPRLVVESHCCDTNYMRSCWPPPA